MWPTSVCNNNLVDSTTQQESRGRYATESDSNYLPHGKLIIGVKHLRERSRDGWRRERAVKERQGSDLVSSWFSYYLSPQSRRALACLCGPRGSLANLSLLKRPKTLVLGDALVISLNLTLGLNFTCVTKHIWMKQVFPRLINYFLFVQVLLS